MNDLDRIARARGGLTVCGAPEGFDALVFCDAARLRGGVSLFICSDDARASEFASACAFFAPDIAPVSYTHLTLPTILRV